MSLLSSSRKRASRSHRALLVAAAALSQSADKLLPAELPDLLQTLLDDRSPAAPLAHST
jgi:hypothetical protein